MKLSKKTIEIIIISIVFILISIHYLYPITKGLIVLPLDMLVSNYSPWYIPGQILVKNPYMQDSILQYYPWRHLVFESFKNGIIPFWNPFQFMGMPFMAGLKSMVFYPLNILFFLGEANSWNLLLYFQILLSLLFMYLLSRSFKLGILVSIITSFAFSFNTLMVGVLEFGSEGQVLLWTPLIIFCAKKYLDQNRGRYLFLLGTTLAVSIFAGQLQYTGYILIFISSFIFFYGRHINARMISYFLLFLSIILGIGISLIQLIPSFELFSNSLRGAGISYDVFVSELVKPYQVLRIFSPDFFGNPVTRDSTIGYIEGFGYFGIIPLFFSVYALVFGWRKSIVKFFGISFLLSILLSIQGIGQIIYFLHIPLITSGTGSRITIIMYTTGALLSGLGINEFLNAKKQKRNIVFVLIFATVFVMSIFINSIFIKHVSGDVKGFLHNVSFAAIIFIIFSCLVFSYMLFKNRYKKSIVVFLILLTVLTYIDFYRLGYRFLTFSNPKFLYPQMKIIKFAKDYSKNTLGREVGLTEPELDTYLNTYSIQTYNPLYPLRSGKLLEALQGKLGSTLPKNKYYLTNGKNLKYALDFLGVSLVIADKNTNPAINFFGSPTFEDTLKLVYKDDRYAAYVNTTSYPRYSLFYSSKVIKDDNKTLSLIKNKSLDFRKEVILKENLPVSLTEGEGSIKLISSNINMQKFQVTSTKPALFYISDTYFPGWQAWVNNKKVKIYLANYDFRAILVPEGKSSVVFNYVPTNFMLGAWSTLVSFIGLIIVSIFQKEFRNKKANNNQS